MKTPTLSVLPAVTGLPRKQEGHLDVLVRLTAPAATTVAKRPSLNLCVVVDCSGSMAGQPLNEAKRAASHLVRKLEAGDQISIVSYGATIGLVAEPMDAVAGRELLLAAIDKLVASGGTPLRAGWLAGADALAPFVSNYGLSRVLLLSDGQATDGSQPELLAQEASQLLAAGISTSTYGLGHNFNEDLMTRLAQGGGGQAFYAETSDALIPYFESEFAMLAATVGRQVSFDINATLDGVNVPVERLDTGEAITGPVASAALVSGASSWVALRIPHAALTAKQSLSLDVQATWQSLDGTEEALSETLEIKTLAKPKPSPDTEVVERLREAEAVRLQREALASARRGDWQNTDRVLSMLSASAHDNAYIQGVAASLTGLANTRSVAAFSKEASYSSLAMSTRVVDAGEQHDTLDAGRFGTRKAHQGKAAPSPKGA